MSFENIENSMSNSTSLKVAASLGRRRRKERVFRYSGMLATAVGIVFLVVFFADLIGKGSTAFVQTFLQLDVELSADVIAPDGEVDLAYADFDGLAKAALRVQFPEVTGRSERRELHRLLSIGAGYQIRELIATDPELMGTTQKLWVPAASSVDMAYSGFAL